MSKVKHVAVGCMLRRRVVGGYALRLHRLATPYAGRPIRSAVADERSVHARRSRDSCAVFALRLKLYSKVFVYMKMCILFIE